MMLTTRTVHIVYCAALLGAAGISIAPAAEAELPTYQARYQVEYKGRHVGDSEQSLEYDAAAGTYVFRSVTAARGLAKLFRPRPIVEESTFLLRNETITPLTFRFEDGTRKGDDDFEITFDWDLGEAAIAFEDGDRVLPLEPGTLDRGALQIALMKDLKSSHTESDPPGPHTLIDEDSVRTYRYSVEGRETLATPAGTHETVRLTQRREGSSRRMVVWAAPDLEYLPIKIEQHRDGEIQTALTLESVQGL